MSEPIDINGYTYDLPADRIALHPLEKRDQAKLLVYNEGVISHLKFTQIADLLEDNSVLVLNNTRVIPARLHFRKPSGAIIEIFLLQPVAPSSLVQQAMLARGEATWKCTIGNVRRWNDGSLLRLEIPGVIVSAELTDRSQGLVRFTWEGDASFAEVIEVIGETPLPPYIRRNADARDKTRYQTVYARHEGAVAAPTAGLHLTDELLEKLKRKNITPAWVTLHVGAGTFMPVKVQNAAEHTMHEEQLIVTRELIEQIQGNRKIVAVGTTSLRVLESIYWFGCKLATGIDAPFMIGQEDPYGRVSPLPIEVSLSNVMRRLEQQPELAGITSIYIRPGYQFRLCDALITNFHQPGSTLMLLVAAFIGPGWREVYREAMDNGYRFLSYGDGSLLIPGKQSRNLISRLNPG
ncbi:MAG TPA: S-adenosylmethionine:tRNA ribosyltransferase-isomerase [Cyclobacteriaceae bacterium]|nr:S-adenosylmethionine:tRNA ribosyltransferase-isomerase [Cyclobacteriaceae bacterium]